MTSLIIFSIVETRPDIAFPTSVVSRFTKNPSYQYIEAIKTIAQYLKITRDTEITYGKKQKKDLIIKGYFNSDWPGDHYNRKSMSRYIFILNSGLVSWCLKLQSIVVFFSTEAEYVVLILEVKKVTWLQFLLTELNLLLPDDQYAEIKVVEGNIGIAEIKANLRDQEKKEVVAIISKKHLKLSIEPSISLKGDNQESITLIHNLVYHTLTNYIDIQHHYIRDKVATR